MGTISHFRALLAKNQPAKGSQSWIIFSFMSGEEVFIQ
jgi:hypothetical protein